MNTLICPKKILSQRDFAVQTASLSLIQMHNCFPNREENKASCIMWADKGIITEIAGCWKLRRCACTLLSARTPLRWEDCWVGNTIVLQHPPPRPSLYNTNFHNKQLREHWTIKINHTWRTQQLYKDQHLCSAEVLFFLPPLPGDVFHIRDVGHWKAVLIQIMWGKE